MANAQLGPKYDLAVRLGNIEKQLAALATSPVGQALSSYQSDGTLGWSVFLNESTGVTTQLTYQGPGSGATETNGLWPIFLYIGQLLSGGVPVGSGMQAFRPDGSVSLNVGNKGVGLIDAHGNQIFTESETAFGGIKTPQMFIGGGGNTNISTWPATTNAGFTTIWSITTPINQPSLAWTAQGFAPAGVTGNFRITLNGTTIVSWSATNSVVVSANFAAIPAGLTWGQPYTINLDAQVAAGAGTVSAQIFGLWGTASS